MYCITTTLPEQETRSEHLCDYQACENPVHVQGKSALKDTLKGASTILKKRDTGLRKVVHIVMKISIQPNEKYMYNALSVVVTKHTIEMKFFSSKRDKTNIRYN